MNSQDPVFISLSTTQALVPEQELKIISLISITTTYLLKKHQALSTKYIPVKKNNFTLLVDILNMQCGCTMYKIILYIYKVLSS